MPEISRFFGVVVRMYYDDHGTPHFHANYSGEEAKISIQPIRVVKGTLPKRALSMVLEWAALHQEELLKNWKLAEAEDELNKIDPLE
jgi:hypothetical protein